MGGVRHRSAREQSFGGHPACGAVRTWPWLLLHPSRRGRSRAMTGRPRRPRGCCIEGANWDRPTGSDAICRRTRCRNVAALQQLAGARDVAHEAVTDAWACGGIIEIRGNEIGHGNAFDFIGEVVGFTRIASLYQGSILCAWSTITMLMFVVGMMSSMSFCWFEILFRLIFRICYYNVHLSHPRSLDKSLEWLSAPHSRLGLLNIDATLTFIFGILPAGGAEWGIPRDLPRAAAACILMCCP
jgi:hypothetical protein